MKFRLPHPHPHPHGYAGYAGAIITDLSKAFDTINHELLIAKLHAYGFEKSALRLINSYLNNR